MMPSRIGLLDVSALGLPQMAYDEKLAARVRVALEERRDVSEKMMFGGLAFMLGGHMCCGIVGEDLMVRVGPNGTLEALAEPHVRPMDFTGKPMNGMVYVAPEGVKTRALLKKWMTRAVRFAESLPAKEPKKKASRARRRS